MTRARGFDGPVLGARYVLGPLLGRGGVGEVRQAWDGVLHRRVAVKLLPGDVQTVLGSAERLHGEALAAARLNCPQVVALYDYAEQDGRPYLVMECLPGSTWADELQAGRPTLQRVADVVGDVLAGLEVAHSAGIVHRDVKPTNILLTERGTAKLGDFGLAQSGDAVALTMPGSVVGTFAYMAPERFGGAAATHASDIWSVGVMLYESLTGCRPFTGDSPLATALAVQRGTHAPLAAERPDLPPAVTSTVERAICRDPLARPSAADLRAALHGGHRSGTDAIPVVAVPTGTVQLATMPFDGGTPRPRPGRTLAVPAVVLAAVVAIVVGGSLLTGKPSPSTTPSASGYTAPSATSARQSTPATQPSRAPARKAVTDASNTSPTTSRRQPRVDVVAGAAASDNSGKAQGKSKGKNKKGKGSKGEDDDDASGSDDD